MLIPGEVFYNKAKWLLKERKRLAGAMLQSGSPVVAEIFGKAGFDVVIIDLEHGSGDFSTLLGQLHAMSRFDVAPIVRSPANDPPVIKRILDAGAHGVLVPGIEDGKSAEQAVLACKYPLEGVRTLGNVTRAGGFGMNRLDYLSSANEQILVVALLETSRAVENIEEIASVVGIDGIFLAPVELATSMGFFCNPAAGPVIEAMDGVEKVVLQSDKFLGTFARGFGDARELYDRGYGLVVTGTDCSCLADAAMAMMQNFRSSYPTR